MLVAEQEKRLRWPGWGVRGTNPESLWAQQTPSICSSVCLSVSPTRAQSFRAELRGVPRHRESRDAQHVTATGAAWILASTSLNRHPWGWAPSQGADCVSGTGRAGRACRSRCPAPRTPAGFSAATRTLTKSSEAGTPGPCPGKSEQQCSWAGVGLSGIFFFFPFGLEQTGNSRGILMCTPALSL